MTPKPKIPENLPLNSPPMAGIAIQDIFSANIRPFA